MQPRKCAEVLVRSSPDDTANPPASESHNLVQELQGKLARLQSENDALREREEQFRQLAENARQVFWMTDAEKEQILFVSPGYEAIWGRPCHTLYENPRQWYEAIAPEDRERVRQAARAKQAHAAYDEEYRIVRPDGDSRWIHDRAFPVRDAQGGIHRVVGIAEDITRWKQVEAQLRLQTAALEAAANGIVITDREGVILWANKAFSRMSDYTMEDVEGCKPSIFKSGQQTEAFYRDMWATVLGGRVWEGELVNRRKDGSFNVEMMTITPVPDESGAIAHFVAVKDDITKRGQAEADRRHLIRRLKETALVTNRHRAQLAAVFQAMQDGVMVFDMDGEVVPLNEAEACVCGYASVEEMRKNVAWLARDYQLALPGGEPLPFEQWPVTRVLRGEQIHDIELQTRRKDNGQEWVFSFSGAPICNDEGRQIFAVIITRDITKRVRTERALRQSQGRLAAIIGSAMDGIVSVNSEQRIVIFNKAAEQMFGYSASQLLGRSLDRLLPERFCADIAKQMHVFGQTGSTPRMTGPLGTIFGLRADGTEFPIEASISQIDEDGHRLFTVILRDVSERLRAEAERARLAAIVESSQEAIIGKTLDGTITNWNVGAELLYGYTAKEAVGQSIGLIIPPDRTGEPQAFMQALRRGERTEAYETVRRRHDGREVRISLSISPITDGAGNLIGASTISRNITRRKEIEEALRLSEQTLADYFAQAPLGLLWVAPDGRILRANRAQLELIGREGENILGESILQWFADSDVAEDMLRRLGAGERLRDIRARLRRKDGAIVHVLIDANDLWRAGRYVHFRWFIRDITRRVELEHDILRAVENEQRRIGRDLHDDLCQQLSGLEFLSQTLANEMKDISLGGAKRALEISRLLRMSIEAARALARGLSPVIMENDGLMLALRDLVESTRRIFRRDCRFCCAAPVAIDDHVGSTHLYRIAQEAVSNAIRHGRAGLIEVTLAEIDGRIVMAVRDNGIGIKEDSSKRTGMGVRVMQYRAAVINGSLVIQRRPEGGTEVVCTVERHD